MIKATGSIGALKLSKNGAPIAILDHAKLGFTLNGKSYTVRRKGSVAPVYELICDDQMPVSVHSSPFVNRFAVTHADRTWKLRAEGLFARRFGLFDGETRVGGITKTTGILNATTMEITIDMPDGLPLAIQVFLPDDALSS